MSNLRAFSRNIPYIRQQFVALLGNTSTSVKFICIVVILSYLLSYSEDAVNVVSVTPGFLMPPAFWIWTAFTFCFLELHFWEVLVDIVTVGLCGKLIEPLWGQMEMLTFFAIVNFGVAVLSTTFYFLLYMCTFNTDLLFNTHIHGLAGYIAGVTVAVKQIMPDLVLIKTPIGKITNRNIPLMVLVASVIFWLVALLDSTYPVMFFNGLLVGWTYLRFYQYHNNGTRGDMADNFTFASFFPNVLQPPISVVSNIIHQFFVRIGICRKVIRKFDMANPTGITISVPGGIDPHDMERRRQIALKALSERLSKSTDYKDRQILPPKTNKVTFANIKTIDDSSKLSKSSINLSQMSQISKSQSEPFISKLNNQQAVLPTQGLKVSQSSASVAPTSDDNDKSPQNVRSEDGAFSLNMSNVTRDT